MVEMESLIEGKTESLDGVSKTLTEASKGFGCSAEGENGSNGDSEQNGVSSLLEMKETVGEGNVNGEEKVSEPVVSLLSVVEENKEVEIKNGGGVPDAVDINGDTEKIDENKSTEIGDKMDIDGGVVGMEDGDMDCEFSVGDFVWGKIKSHPWWPGQIYDPKDASDDAIKMRNKGRLLVAYFGDGTFAWCLPSQLKPFEENFVEVSKHSNSKSFLNAVEEAVDVISRLVEMKMMSASELERPIVENAGIKEGVRVPDGIIGKLSFGLSAPDEVLGKLKHVAQVVTMSSSLDSMVLKGWLSAFYRAKGFSKLPAYEDPQDVPGLEENAGALVVDINDYNAGMNVSFQGPSQEDLLSSPSGTKFGAVDASGERVHPAKQKSIAAIMESDVGSVVNNGNAVAKGTKSGKSASTARRKRKGSDETKADNGEAGNTPSGKVENNGNGVKEDTIEAHSVRGKQKKSKSSSSDNDDVEGSKNGGENAGRNDAMLEEPVEKGALSRERKKSKYLSPPYTIPIGRRYMDIDADSFKNSQDSVQLVVTPLVANGSSEPATKKKIPKELDQQHSESDDAIQESLITSVMVDAPISELLAEVRSTALSPQYPNDNVIFDAAREFLSVFRSSVYQDGTSNKMSKQSQSQKKRKLQDLEKEQNQTAIGSTERKSKRATTKENQEVKSNELETKQAPKAKKPKMMELSAVSDTKEKPLDSNGKASPTALFVTFGPGSKLPSKDDLIEVYSKYGPLNVEETDMLYANFGGKVVFMNKSDAKEAFKSSQNATPFPSAKASFELHKMPADSKTQRRKQAKTEEAAKATEKAEDEPLQSSYIRDKLKMLVSILETSDEKMTPEIKSRLLGEMKDLMEKVSAADVSSS